MDSFVLKFRMLLAIKWTKTTLVICFLPFALLFVLMHIVILILDDHDGAIVTDSSICADIGKNVLLDGGSVVDAAIAIIFCESVVLPNRYGMGGGFSAVIYMGRSIETIVATPKIPQSIKSGYTKDDFDLEGAKSSAVPGTLMGCWQMHRKFGILSWKRLLEPTIKLCEEGVSKDYVLIRGEQSTVVDAERLMVITRILDAMEEEPEGEKIKFLNLAQTLRLIAAKGASIFYNGSVGEDLIDDLQAEGGTMTMADLRNYSVSWSSDYISFRLNGNRKAFTTPLPTSGAIVALVMNVIRKMPNEGALLFWHRTIEAMKHAYGLSFDLADIAQEENEHLAKLIRETYNSMIDIDFAARIRDLICIDCLQRNLSYYSVRHRSSFQSSSGSICISGPSGDAIVLTADMLMREKGKAFYSETTGILLNNAMNSFRPAIKNKLPASPNSFLRPGKRAFSSHSPVLVLNRFKAEVRLLISASGDEVATAQVITALIKISIEHESAFSASNSFVFYPDLFQRKVVLQLPTTELGLAPNIVDLLNKLGHNVEPTKNAFPYAVRCVILNRGTNPAAEFTYREDGGTQIVRTHHNLTIFLGFIVVAVSAFIIGMMCIQVANKTKMLNEPNEIAEGSSFFNQL